MTYSVWDLTRGFAVSTFHNLLFKINFWDASIQHQEAGELSSFVLSAHISPIQDSVQNPTKQFCDEIWQSQIPERWPPLLHLEGHYCCISLPPCRNRETHIFIGGTRQYPPLRVEKCKLAQLWGEATPEQLLKHRIFTCFDQQSHVKKCTKMFSEALFVKEKESRKQLLINVGGVLNKGTCTLKNAR